MHLIKKQGLCEDGSSFFSLYYSYSLLSRWLLKISRLFVLLPARSLRVNTFWQHGIKAEHLFNTEASPHLSLYWQRVCSWPWSTHWNHQPCYRGSHLCCPFSWWARCRCCCYFCLQVLQRDLAQGGSCWTWSFDQQACRLDGTWQGWTCCIGCSW